MRNNKKVIFTFYILLFSTININKRKAKVILTWIIIMATMLTMTEILNKCI